METITIRVYEDVWDVIYLEGTAGQVRHRHKYNDAEWHQFKSFGEALDFAVDAAARHSKKVAEEFAAKRVYAK